MTDKQESGLLRFYDEYFLPKKDKKITFLEIGVFRGESLDYFNDYFTNPETKIIGYDFQFLHTNKHPRVSLVMGNQENIFELQSLGNKKGPFDIILDDCSHYGELTQRSFDFLFDHLISGGSYIIEDWTAGSYSSQFRGIPKMLEVCLENFNNYKIKEVRALRLPEGGTVAIIEKL